ncbi:MAG: aldo/keto reductase [Phototrophicaceae bacterium]|jgi:aryl-alcohol dehydrogenase-like predicted oxidoreductase
MEYRVLGGSGFSVPALSFGTGTFGGNHDFFGKWGNSNVAQATNIVDMCLEAGVTLFDTADVYSFGQSEEILGEAIKGRRDKVLISTKSTFRMSAEPNDVGTSRFHLIRSCEASLRRLNTDYVDIYTIHGFDARTDVEETLRALDTLVQSGKVRYLVCSNFSGWHLMKSLAISEKYGWSRYVGHQAHYSLLRREYEWELMPLALDQRVGTLVWGPLSQGRLSGRFRRNHPIPEGSRVAQGADEGPPVPPEWLYSIVDALDEISAETGKTVAQISLNWLLQRPTVSTVLIGARHEEQLRENLGAVGWNLTAEQVARLDAVSETDTIYPYWHQRGFTERNPVATPLYK